MYFLWLCIHLLSAVCFVGYVFFDCVIYPLAYRLAGKDQCDEVKRAYSKGGAKIFGIIFVLLIVSGIGLASEYGWANLINMQSNFSILFLLKMSLLLIMLIITVYSVYKTVIQKRKNPFGNYSHLIALGLCVGIILCAKAMIVF